ncbi:uncharacterized protein LOC104582387 [Brachypodium distachyon]|uniref:uncharacterized protein LOC104582387 n=1 Tax=Brachypodium distachyon TaxID=15368 RepID=UPI00053005C9|nr:uncharacterized protein LOC104582387 [Brachypodium distachyon]|eukprot:XP_010230201.1 uncharacterized protein LOC104582387 [Brachypodium distachyon]
MTASFWHSSWSHSQHLRAAYPLLFACSRRKGRSVAQALDDNRWVLDLPDRSTPLLLEFVHAWREIRHANIVLQSGVPDSICWTLTNSGQYSPRSAYLLHFIGRTNSDLL